MRKNPTYDQALRGEGRGGRSRVVVELELFTLSACTRFYVFLAMFHAVWLLAASQATMIPHSFASHHCTTKDRRIESDLSKYSKRPAEYGDLEAI